MENTEGRIASLSWPTLFFLHLHRTCFLLFRVDCVWGLQTDRAKSLLGLNLPEINVRYKARPARGCFSCRSPGAGPGQAARCAGRTRHVVLPGHCSSSPHCSDLSWAVVFPSGRGQEAGGGWLRLSFPSLREAMQPLASRAEGKLGQRSQFCYIQGVHFPVFQKKLLWGKQKFFQSFSSPHNELCR